MTYHKTSAEVSAVILAKHKDEMTVFSSYTDTEGIQEGSGGLPTIETEWGFKDADYPLIKIYSTKPGDKWEYQYFLLIPNKDVN